MTRKRKRGRIAHLRVVRLYAGDRTGWRVHQTVRKLYLGPTESPAG